jgi:hypothetical protein
MLADDDEVTLEHAIATYRGLPDAEVIVVAGRDVRARVPRR